MLQRILALLLVTAFLLPASAQEVYRWVDEEGNVHYTDTPPPDEREVERVQVRSGPAPIEDEADEDENDEDLDDEERPRLSEGECEGMRDRLAEYRDADVLFRINEQGEQEELEPEAAEAEMDRLQSQIDDYCD